MGSMSWPTGMRIWIVLTALWIGSVLVYLVETDQIARFGNAFQGVAPTVLNARECNGLLDVNAETLCHGVVAASAVRREHVAQVEVRWAVTWFAALLIPPGVALGGLVTALGLRDGQMREASRERARMMREEKIAERAANREEQARRIAVRKVRGPDDGRSMDATRQKIRATLYDASRGRG